MARPPDPAENPARDPAPIPRPILPGGRRLPDLSRDPDYLALKAQLGEPLSAAERAFLADAQAVAAELRRGRTALESATALLRALTTDGGADEQHPR